MAFKDEMKLRYSDEEKLASRLAIESERDSMEYLEYLEYLECRDITELRSVERPDVNILGRLLFVPTYILLRTLCCIKWVFTGKGLDK